MTLHADPEGATRIYLKRHPLLADLGFNVFLDQPESDPEKYIDLRQVRTDMDRSTPVEAAHLSLNVWAPSKWEAADAVRALKDIAFTAAGDDLNPATHCLAMSVDNVLYLPDRSDPENIRQRYVVDITVTVRST